MIALLLTISGILLFFFSDLSIDYKESAYLLEIEGRSYNLKAPTSRWDLPRELEEISGLSYFQKNKLACVQDEHGDLFIYDLRKKEIVRKEKFGPDGDYEGVEVVKDTVFVLRSDGDVFYFQLKNRDIGEVFKIKTDLSKSNDTEGLGFQIEYQEILIACKEAPGTKKINIEKSRTVYRITNDDKIFKKKPRYIIDGKAYAKMLENRGFSKKKHRPFKPSGIAVHPKSGHIFVIGTVGKMMIVLNSDSEIVDLIPLDPSVFWQPEGICFSPNGDLFISSEGRGRRGYILKF
jgi:uncharacterized protein YjiK